MKNLCCATHCRNASKLLFPKWDAFTLQFLQNVMQSPQLWKVINQSKVSVIKLLFEKGETFVFYTRRELRNTYELLFVGQIRVLWVKLSQSSRFQVRFVVKVHFSTLNAGKQHSACHRCRPEFGALHGHSQNWTRPLHWDSSEHSLPAVQSPYICSSDTPLTSVPLLPHLTHWFLPMRKKDADDDSLRKAPEFMSKTRQKYAWRGFRLVIFLHIIIVFCIWFCFLSVLAEVL